MKGKYPAVKKKRKKKCVTQEVGVFWFRIAQREEETPCSCRADTEGRGLEPRESSTVDLPPPIHHSHSPSPLALPHPPPPPFTLAAQPPPSPSSPISERSVSIRPYHFPHSLPAPPLTPSPPATLHFLQVEESILHTRRAGGGSDYWVG